MNPERYLERLGLPGAVRPTHPSLVALQQAHLLTVPFENLSVIRHEPIILDEQLLVAKIVERGRGGFCYELNGAFAWLLRQLGFHVSLVSARVYNAARDEFGPEFDHMALIVHLATDYLVDVGFGDSVRAPIALPAGAAEDVSGRYRIVAVTDLPQTYSLQRWQDASWQNQYLFTPAPRQLADYAAMCTYHQSSPDSHFTQRTVCTIATVAGRLTLSTDALTITEHGEKRRLIVATAQDFQQRLKRHFGVYL